MNNQLEGADKLNNYWKIFQTNLDWIRVSDQKATIILTIYGIIIPFVNSRSEELFESISEHQELLVLMGLSGIASLISMYSAFRCLTPRIFKNFRPSVIFFGSIVEQYPDDQSYLQALRKKMNSEELFEEEIAEQIYINSRVAFRKFKDVSTAIRFFALGLVFLIISIVASALVVH